MDFSFRRAPAVFCLAMITLGVMVVAAQTPPAGGASASAAVTRAAGVIKSAQADSLVVTQDSGGELTATLSATTKILRVPPGEKDLKNAVPLQVQDLQPGDRVLVRGQASADGHSIAALAVIAMKQADVTAKQEHDRDDWQKRGVGGLVTAADAAAGTITISSAGLTGKHDILIHTSKSTTARRYAPDSVKFDDARPAPLDQIKAGDQLRARGARNADGSEVTAEEIVFGTFRNIAGTITAIDPASNSMTVHDLIAKASVTVKIAPDSQIKKLPAEMATRIAMRLKGGGEQSSAGAGGGGNWPRQTSGSGAPSNGNGQATGGGQRPGGGAPPDLQRFLGRMPNSALTDLQKGDAVMIVSTQSPDPATVTAITVLGGVEAMMTASPERAMTLSPWSLSGGGGEGEAAAQ